jgi:hypothetical protein
MALVGHISGSSQSNSVIGISGSVIVANAPNETFPSLPGADVKFFVNDLAALGTSGLVSSGSIIVKSDEGSASFSVSTAGAVVAASAVLGGNITVGGNIVADGDEAKSIFSAVTTANNAITIGGGGIVVAGGDLKVMGNDIQASDGNTNITMTSNTLTAFAGDVKIGGNDIQASDGSTAITLSGQNVLMPGSVNVAGDLTVNGTTITADVATVTVEDPLIALGFTSGSVAVTAGDRGFVGGISGGDNVAVFWDNSESEFAVARTASTPDAAAVSVASYGKFHAGVVRADGGFSGSLTKLTDGSSYLLAGNNVSITTGSTGAVTIAVSMNAQAIVGGSNTSVQFNDSGAFGGNAFFTFDKNGGVNGLGKLSVNEVLSTALTSSALIAGSSTVNVFNTTATTLNLGGAATTIEIGAASGTTSINNSLAVDGSVVLGDAAADTVLVNGTATFASAGATTFAGDIAVNGGDITTTSGAATLFNSNATALSIGGSATTMLVGASNVVMGIGGASPTNSTIVVSTGSFGRVLASSTSTFTGATTHNGGISTTTLGVSSAAALQSTLSVNGVSTFTGATVHNGGISTTTLGVSSAAALQSTLSVVGNITGQGTSNQLNSLSVTGSLGLSVTSGMTVAGAAAFLGNVALGDATGDSIVYNGRVASSILPSADCAFNLGSATNRWANIFTGDLHLKNERGDYTLIEEPDFLSIRFNKTGKRYKFVLEHVPEFDEELGKFSAGPAPAGAVKHAKKVK